jgi:hypothetical protein
MSRSRESRLFVEFGTSGMHEMIESLAEGEQSRLKHFLRRWGVCGTWVYEQREKQDFDSWLKQKSDCNQLQGLRAGLGTDYPLRARGDDDKPELLKVGQWEELLGWTPDSVVVWAETKKNAVEEVRSLLRPMLRLSRSVEIIDRYGLRALKQTLSLVTEANPTIKVFLYSPWGQQERFDGPATKEKLINECTDAQEAGEGELWVVPVPVAKFWEGSHDRFVAFHLNHVQEMPSRVVQVGKGVQALDAETIGLAPVTIGLVDAKEYDDKVRKRFKEYYQPIRIQRHSLTAASSG